MIENYQLEKLRSIPESGDVFLFKSCTINSLYPSVEASTRKCLKRLGFQVLESDAQTCCTDPLYYSNLEDDIQMTAIMARNLAVIEKYSKVIVTECNGCFSTLIQAIENLKKKRIKEKIDPIISKYGYKLSNDFLIIHIIELYFKILPKIVELKKFDLRNIRIAAHYGCNFARAHPEQIITDPQNPQIIEKIIENCNGIPLQYTEMGCCCGAGIIQRNINPDLSLDVSYQKMKSISEVDPDLIVTICPFCMSTLENCQLSLEVEKNLELSIPVIHISELIGVILGFDPVSELGLNSHAIDLMPVIKKIREG